MNNKKKEYQLGQQMGLCIYLGEAGMAKGVHQDRRMAKFKCHCGKEFISAIEYVKTGKTKSCGCLFDKVKYRVMPEYDDRIENIFWSRALLTANPDRCWEWTMKKDSDGYGTYNVGYTTIRSHRFAYYVYYKIDPKELQVCHKCDNPGCINPNHLFLGTTQENTKDRDLKGRHNPARGSKNGNYTKPESRPKGSSHWNAKFTESDILNLLELYKSGKYTNKELAERFNCHKNYINNIMCGKVWSQVTNIPKKYKSKSKWQHL